MSSSVADVTVEDLCAPVAEVYVDAAEAETVESLRGALSRLGVAERELVEGLRDLKPSAEADAEFDRYIDRLEAYSHAQELASRSTNRSAQLERLVGAAKAGVELEETARLAGLPDTCPPPSTVDVENTLFVARANLECFQIGQDVTVAGPIETPQSPEEVSLVLDLGKRVTAGVARVVRDSASGETQDVVKGVIRASKQRYRGIGELERTFEVGNYEAYKHAGAALRRLSRRVDRQLLSVGLIDCSRVFHLLPF